MPEPDWKQELYAALKGELDERLRMHTELAREFLANALGGAVLPHIEAAYQRGLVAGRSQAGYREKPARVRLTDRQLEIARLAATGLTNPEIAARLFLSTDTVRTHMRAALRRTGARSRGHLAALLAVNGQVTTVNVPNPKENGACTAAAAGPTPASSTDEP